MFNFAFRFLSSVLKAAFTVVSFTVKSVGFLIGMALLMGVVIAPAVVLIASDIKDPLLVLHFLALVVYPAVVVWVGFRLIDVLKGKSVKPVNAADALLFNSDRPIYAPKKWMDEETPGSHEHAIKYGPMLPGTAAHLKTHGSLD